MELDLDRRQFLEAAGTGTVLSLSGCGAIQGDPAPSTDTTTGTPTSGQMTGTDTTTETPTSTQAVVTVVLNIDQQTLRQRRQEIQAELQSGNISRTEAQQRLQRVQTELRTQAVTSFTDRVRSTAALSATDSVASLGVVLMSGPAPELINLLSLDTVRGLFPETTFEQAKTQAEQQSETTTATNSS